MPIADIVVLDTNDFASCWQYGTMADLPQASGDAPAIYVDENVLAGRILMISGYWTFPRPYRWVSHYAVGVDAGTELCPSTPAGDNPDQHIPPRLPKRRTGPSCCPVLHELLCKGTDYCL